MDLDFSQRIRLNAPVIVLFFLQIEGSAFDFIFDIIFIKIILGIGVGHAEFIAAADNQLTDAQLRRNILKLLQRPRFGGFVGVEVIHEASINIDVMVVGIIFNIDGVAIDGSSDVRAANPTNQTKQGANQAAAQTDFR